MPGHQQVAGRPRMTKLGITRKFGDISGRSWLYVSHPPSGQPMRVAMVIPGMQERASPMHKHFPHLCVMFANIPWAKAFTKLSPEGEGTALSHGKGHGYK